MTRSISSLSVILSTLLLVACGRGGPPDGEGSGSGDGGAGDGGVGDGGADTGGPELGIGGLRGDGTATPGIGSSYTGTEAVYFQTLEGEDRCVIESTLTNTTLAAPPCGSCDWTFTLVTSDSALTTSTDCPDVDPTAYDGATFSYAYVDAGKYGLLAYYYTGYGWYGTYATAWWDSSTSEFTYDWPQQYVYFY